jgi:hypothetical protein
MPFILWRSASKKQMVPKKQSKSDVLIDQVTIWDFLKGDMALAEVELHYGRNEWSIPYCSKHYASQESPDLPQWQPPWNHRPTGTDLSLSYFTISYLLLISYYA